MACSDGWAIATALGTIGATISALGIALWQGLRDRIAAREIRRAIAPALTEDLVLVDQLMVTLQSLAADIYDVRAANGTRIQEVLRLASTLGAPAFDRFRELLPKLGPSAAPKVIAVYGRIARTGEAVRSYTSNKDDKQELALIVDSLKRNASSLQTSVRDAIALLEAV